MSENYLKIDKSNLFNVQGVVTGEVGGFYSVFDSERMALLFLSIQLQS